MKTPTQSADVYNRMEKRPRSPCLDYNVVYTYICIIYVYIRLYTIWAWEEESRLVVGMSSSTSYERFGEVVARGDGVGCEGVVVCGGGEEKRYQ